MKVEEKEVQNELFYLLFYSTVNNRKEKLELVSIICYKINMKKRSKVIITTLSLVCVLFVYYNIDYKYDPKYKIIGNISMSKPYAMYSKGDVYIIKNRNMLNSSLFKDTDIIVIDERNDDNPSMQIISSCNIADKEVRNEVIEIIQEYNKEYPSNWKRTNESLRLEWFVHNFLYLFNYKTDHTTDVDLDNNDEDNYNKPVVNKMLKI